MDVSAIIRFRDCGTEELFKFLGVVVCDFALQCEGFNAVWVGDVLLAPGS